MGRCARQALIGLVAAIVLCAPDGASAQAAPLCAPPSPGSSPAYQSALLPLLERAAPTPPPSPGTPPLPAPRSGPGAFDLARNVLAGQFAGGWVNDDVQGWVVGVAPGPLGVAAARAAIVEALGQHFAGSDLAELTRRLHVDQQPYSEAARVRISVRVTRPAVRGLSVRSGGRTRTIGGARLRKPLVVALRTERTTVVVTVRLADGRTATHSPTYVRCG